MLLRNFDLFIAKSVTTATIDCVSGIIDPNEGINNNKDTNFDTT